MATRPLHQHDIPQTEPGEKPVEPDQGPVEPMVPDANEDQPADPMP